MQQTENVWEDVRVRKLEEKLALIRWRLNKDTNGDFFLTKNDYKELFGEEKEYNK